MRNRDLIAPWIRRFLLEYIVGERNLARNTQISYRDTLALLLPLAAEQTKTAIDRLRIEQLSVDIVRSFLHHLERNRGCSIATRNQRLAAIHATARFIATHNPEYVSWCAEIRAVPFKKTSKPTLTYLEKPEIDALLEAPDRTTPKGQQDYALLLFLYNTGARVSEAAHVTIADLNLGNPPSVRIVGKGNKVRYCPLWSSAREALSTLTTGRANGERVFLNRRKQPFTRFGIHALVKRCAAIAGEEVTSLQRKKVTPHTVRHSTAVHLLRAGVDINTIRAWLGHVSIDTTNIYAEIDLEMKAKALAHCEVPGSDRAEKQWHQRPEIMEFLRRL